MNEKTLTNKILRELRAQGAWCVKVFGGSVYQTAGLPDIIGCHLGMFFGLEVKAPGREKTVTKLQTAQIAAINKSGGMAVVVSSITEALDVLEAIESSMGNDNGPN